MGDTKSDRPVGRPTKLTKQVIKDVCCCISDGLKYEDACLVAGISVSSFCEWRVKGEKQPDTIYGELLDSVKKAQAKRKQRLLKKIEAAGDEQWQANAWILERGHPDEFGKTKVEHEGTINLHFDRDDEKL